MNSLLSSKLSRTLQTNEVIKDNEKTTSDNKTTSSQSQAKRRRIERLAISDSLNPSRFYLDFLVNNYLTRMKMGSARYESIINVETWESMGKPDLKKPDKVKTTVHGSGAIVHIRGHFMADVVIYGRSFQLPLHVSTDRGTRNLAGLEWFDALDLNWDLVFYPYYLTQSMDPRGPFLNSEKMEQQSCNEDTRTKRIRIKVIINGTVVDMVVDSAAKYSRISYETFGKIIKQKNNEGLSLLPCDVVVKDTANQSIKFKGQFIAEVRYAHDCEGQYHEHQMPLLVTEDTYSDVNIFGTNWFKRQDPEEWLKFNEMFRQSRW